MSLVEEIKKNQEVDFNDVIKHIDDSYDFSPSSFKNGSLVNEEGQNNGSCKILAFGSLEKLSEQQTLNCFGKYYKEDVLNDPNGSGHGNIRNFMNEGWDGIHFEKFPLKKKN